MSSTVFVLMECQSGSGTVHALLPISSSGGGARIWPQFGDSADDEGSEDIAQVFAEKPSVNVLHGRTWLRLVEQEVWTGRGGCGS